MSSSQNDSVSSLVQNPIQSFNPESIDQEHRAALTEDAQPQFEFDQFAISENVLSSLRSMGFTAPTEIQKKCFSQLLSAEDGAVRRDVVALARTGTGKTAAFGIPMIESLDLNQNSTQALVLCPTRELCLQVSQSLIQMGRLSKVKVMSIYGGDSYRRQIEGLKRGAHVVVATPGRLMDLMDRDGVIDFSGVKTLILDEADEMISVGFREALDQILSRFQSVLEQTWLFSATMSPEVSRITKKYTSNPIFIDVTKGTENKLLIRQQAMVTYEEDRVEALVRYLHLNPEFYGLVFCQTKAEVAETEEALNAEGFKVSALHGDKSQNERESVFAAWKKGRVRIVVATDVAARGLDVTGLTHVVNMSLPRERESYVHRIGRTGRAGREGIALTFVWPKRLQLLKRFERELGVRFEMVQPPSADQVIQALSKRALDETLSSTAPVDARLARVVRAELQERFLKNWEQDSASENEDSQTKTNELVQFVQDTLSRMIASRFARALQRAEVRSVRVDLHKEGGSGERSDRGGFGRRSGGPYGGRGDRRDGGPRSDRGRGPRPSGRSFGGPRSQADSSGPRAHGFSNEGGGPSRPAARGPVGRGGPKRSGSSAGGGSGIGGAKPLRDRYR